MIWGASHYQQEATDEGNQARPEEGRQVIATLIGNQRDHGYSHAHSQRD